MGKEMNNKYVCGVMNISRMLIGLINETLRYFPLGLVMIFVVLFYFVPDDVLGDIIHEWQKTDVSGTIYIVRLWLKTTLLCVFAAIFLKYLSSDVFMSKMRVDINGDGNNKKSGE